jgi:hypothetical protein
MDLSNLCEIEIIANEVETKSARRRFIRRASGDDRIVVKEMDIIESDFPASKSISGIELPNSLAVRRGIVEMELSFKVRIRKSSGALHEKISRTRDGIVVPQQSLDRRNIGVVDIGTQGESAVAGEMTVLKRDCGVKTRGRVIAAQGRVVKCDALEGKLDRCGKRIPLGLKGMGPGRSGKRYVEIVGLQATGELRGKNRTTHAAIEVRVAVQFDVVHRRAANSAYKGQPVRETGSGDGQVDGG